jgi:hypothetical protein
MDPLQNIPGLPTYFGDNPAFKKVIRNYSDPVYQGSLSYLIVTKPPMGHSKENDIVYALLYNGGLKQNKQDFLIDIEAKHKNFIYVSGLHEESKYHMRIESFGHLYGGKNKKDYFEGDSIPHWIGNITQRIPTSDAQPISNLLGINFSALFAIAGASTVYRIPNYVNF